MQRFIYLALTTILLFGLTGFEATAGNQESQTLDLANIPLTVQDLPEEGYQVMAGGYLQHDEMAGFIAGPRNLSPESVQARLDEAAVASVYVLDLVLPEDRAWQDSPLLAMHQTTVYLVNETSAESLKELLLDHSNIQFMEETDSAVDDATTVHWEGESGEQLRTVVIQDDVVLEIVSLDTTGRPDATEHALVVEGTLEQLEMVRSGDSVGLSTMALNLVPGDDVADFFNAPQTGVHGIYRLRDGGIQPAMGEIEADSFGADPAFTSMYYGHNLVQSGGGTSSVSVILYEFTDGEIAQSAYETLVSSPPADQLIDPFFTIGEDENWTDQGVVGLYRVSGSWNNNDYSGFVEIRAEGNVIAVVGHRSIGAMLPDATVTNALMDHQLMCLQAQTLCPPFELMVQSTPTQATPVVAEDSLGSGEFGWSLPELGPEWVVDEQFTEAGYDRLGLRNGVSIFEFESVINHHGDPLQCVMEELDLLEELEEHSVITVWEDASGNTDGGNSATQAWITYRVEPLAEERADQEYVIRIDCFALVEGSANLVVKHIAPVDFYEEERAKGESLRNSISFPESAATRGKLAASAHYRRTIMIISHFTHQAA